MLTCPSKICTTRVSEKPPLCISLARKFNQDWSFVRSIVPLDGASFFEGTWSAMYCTIAAPSVRSVPSSSASAWNVTKRVDALVVTAVFDNLRVLVDFDSGKGQPCLVER